MFLITNVNIDFARSSSFVGDPNEAPTDYISDFAVCLAKIGALTNARSCVELSMRVPIDLATPQALFNYVGGVFLNSQHLETVRIEIDSTTHEVKRRKEIEAMREKERMEKASKDLTFLQIAKSLRWFGLTPKCSDAVMLLIDALMTQRGNPLQADILRVLRYTLDLNIISLQSQILWQLLALKEQAHVAEVMTHEMSKISHERKNSILSVLLDGVCQRNLPLEHKTLRNDIAVIVNTIADLCHEMVNKSFSSGFTDTIAHYLMSHELGGLSNIMKMAALKKDSNVAQTTDDYEFKKILMGLAMNLCSHSGNMTKLLNAGLLEFLLLYLERDSANEGVLVWTDKQLQGLQLQAISFLNSLVPRIPQKWSSANGNSALLEYLTDLLKRHQSKAAAQTQSMISIPTAAAAKRAASAAVNPPISRTVWTGLVGGTLRLLSRISELGPSQKRALGGQGAFDVLIDTKETEAVLLAAVECIWGSICGSSVNEATFFAADGIFALLDLVAKSSYILRRHILGCLLDLLENPKARSHVLEWRSSANEQTGVVHLLVSLWNSEETRLGEKVPSGFAGKLIDEKRPLYGKNQTIHEGHSKDGFVIEELSENLRAKIYSMFCKLGFERFSEKITAAEQVKLTLIAKFLDFKIGQVWEEISDELDYEGIRPVSPDLDCILTAKQVIMEKARAIIQKQDDSIEKAAQNERIEEAAFYSTYAKQRGIQTTGVSLLKLS
ncbi:hypothetical protein HDU82_006437 [Entophlyctis luteolus]|nr:hypothetical protein HDU82_006437 [Entophlyctis luteolus]